MTVVVRLSGAPPNLSADVRQVAQSIGPRVLVGQVRTAEALVGDAITTPRQRVVLLGLLGGLGLVLALVGVYGVTAYAVGRRTSEIGLRIVFGALPGGVVAMVLRSTVVPVAVGSAAGICAAAVATRVLESFLPETSSTDPLVMGTVAVALVLAGCAAAVVPALRAAGIDPLSSLRAEWPALLSRLFRKPRSQWAVEEIGLACARLRFAAFQSLTSRPPRIVAAARVRFDTEDGWGRSEPVTRRRRELCLAPQARRG